MKRERLNMILFGALILSLCAAFWLDHEREAWRSEAENTTRLLAPPFPK